MEGRGKGATEEAHCGGAPPLWIPEFAGMTVVGEGFPLSRDGRFAKRPYGGLVAMMRRRT